MDVIFSVIKKILVKKMRKQATDWEKIFAKDIPDIELLENT